MVNAETEFARMDWEEVTSAYYGVLLSIERNSAILDNLWVKT